MQTPAPETEPPKGKSKRLTYFQLSVVAAAVTGLILLLVMCSNMQIPPEEQAAREAEKASEEATKEAGKSLDQKRKDAGLPSCKDDEDEVVRRANSFLDTFGDIKGLDDEITERVDVDGDTPSITCSAKANLDNVFDGYTYIKYVWKKSGDNLWVDVSKGIQRGREEATKEAKERGR